MAVILDEAGLPLLDELLASIFDEAGQPTTPVDVQVTMGCEAYTSVTAQATMEFEAGQPVNLDGAALASAPWTSMYPG